jgi:hypothetical protein
VSENTDKQAHDEQAAEAAAQAYEDGTGTWGAYLAVVSPLAEDERYPHATDEDAHNAETAEGEADRAWAAAKEHGATDAEAEAAESAARVAYLRACWRVRAEQKRQEANAAYVRLRAEQAQRAADAAVLAVRREAYAEVLVLRRALADAHRAEETARERALDAENAASEADDAYAAAYPDAWPSGADTDPEAETDDARTDTSEAQRDADHHRRRARGW